MNNLLNYILTTIIFIVFAIPLKATAQNKNSFMAFGHKPEVVHPSLYKALQNALNPEERLILLDSIATQFLRPNNADSLLHYGSKIKNETLNLEKNSKLVQDYHLKAMLYKGLGSQSMGLLNESIGYFLDGIATSQNNKIILFENKIGLANTYILNEKPLKAKAILDEIPLNNLEYNLLLKHNLASVNFYILNNEFEAAQTLINTTLSILNKEENLKQYLQLKKSLGVLKAKEGNYDEALSVFFNIKNEALTEGYYDIYTSIILNEGTIFSINKDYENAAIALNSAYVNAIQWNRLELQQKIINALVKVHVAQKDYKNAYNLKTQLDYVNSQIATKQNLRFVKDLEFKYETLKKEKKISTLQEDQLKKQAEIERQKTIKYAFLIGFLVVLIPIILLLVVYYQKLQTQSLLNKKQEALNQQEMTSVLQAQELELVKNTIGVQNKERDRIARELHDSIGANIAGIKLQMTNFVDDNPKANTLLEQLEKTYQHVRDISHSLIPSEFKENSFTILVENYIVSLRDNNTVTINFGAYPENTINTLSYPLQSGLLNIIKELITNAFKHAKANEIDLQINVLTNENSIELLYEDDGIGFNIKETNKGIGLQNIEHRVAAFNGQFSINSAINRGTVITISIPQQ